MKNKLLNSIISINVFCLFILISRLIYSNEFPSYEFDVWIGNQPILVQFAIWFPLAVGIVFFALFLVDVLKQNDKNKQSS